MNSTLVRAISGAIYVVLLVFGITYNYISQSVLLGLFLVLSQIELNGIFKKLGGYSFAPALLTSLVLFMATWLTIYDEVLHGILLLLAVPVIFFGYLGKEVFAVRESSLQRVMNTGLGVLYAAIPISIGLLLGSYGNGETKGYYLLVVFIVLWSNDTLAFIFGKWLGKHKLLERVSPNKTIEGFIGGLLGSIAASIIIWKFTDLNLNLVEWIIFGTIVSFSGTIGDLFESLLKRTSGLKDSGKIMPGHGGILDRLDSFLFAVPFVYFYLLILELI